MKKFSIIFLVVFFSVGTIISGLTTQATAAEIDVQRPAGTSIPDGGSDNAGNPIVGPVSLTYTIDNTAGTDVLNITIISFSNFVNVSGFSVGWPGPVPAGGTGALGIAFNVDSAGVFSFYMQISSNDSDENPYNISVSGGPTEIDVLGNDNSIADGDSSPSLADDTDFGSTQVNGSTADRTFTIENIGGTNLNLSGGPPCVIVTGSHFSLLYDAVTPVVGGTSTTFTVRFDPSAPGLHSAVVSIENDDSDEDPYEFTIQGNGTEVSGADPVFDRSGGGCFIESLIGF